MGTLRVISGSAKGVRLKSVPGDSTRPITDRVKESLFNILGADIEGQTILDLFAGTGAVGIEALSRGAEFITFVEINYQAIKVIKQNLLATKLDEFAEVLKRDAFEYLRSGIQKEFDMIYIAPPQYKKLWQAALQLLDQNPGWLKNDGYLIVQINPLEWEALELENYRSTEQRKYGDTLLEFYAKT